MRDPHRGIRRKRYDPPGPRGRGWFGVVAAAKGTAQCHSAASFSTEHVVAPLLVTDHVVGVVGCGVLRWFVRLDAGRHCAPLPCHITLHDTYHCLSLTSLTS